MTKNPLQVSHDDMINQARSQLLYMQRTYPAKVNEQSMSGWVATNKIEIQKRIVALLEKTKPVKQGNLFKQQTKV